MLLRDMHVCTAYPFPLPISVYCPLFRVVFGYEGKSYDLKVVETGGECEAVQGEHKWVRLSRLHLR